MEQKEEVPSVPPAVHPTPTLAWRCSISAKQVEEIFHRSECHRRAFPFFAEWVRDNVKGSSDFFRVPHGVEGIEGRPEKWFLRTLDTWRFRNLSWRSIIFHAVPGYNGEPALFKAAIHVLETTAVPLMVLMARYEKAGIGRDRTAVVLSLDIPFDCLKDFINTQNKMNQLEAEKAKILAKGEENTDKQQIERIDKEISRLGHDLRDNWKDEGINDDLYRQASLTLFGLRNPSSHKGPEGGRENEDSGFEPPFILLHSKPDDRHTVVWFRDFALVTPEFQGRMMSLVQRDLTAPPPSSSSSYEFLEWPIHQHAPEVETPEMLCENPGCSKSGGPPPDERVLASFKDHFGAKEKVLLSSSFFSSFINFLNS
jgi:hypothetical protein